MRTWLTICGVTCFMLLFGHKGPAHAAEQLTLWVQPYLPATKLIKKFTPLIDYLNTETGLEIKIKISKDYRNHIDRIGENHIDFAYMGPAPYVIMTGKYGPKTLIAGLEVNGKPFYSGMIIVRKGSPIKKMADLRGKRFAFGDLNSTMNHLIPHYMLRQAGIFDEDMAEMAFLGSHSNIALGVLGGYYDAGGVKEAIFYQYEGRGLVKLAQSPPIAEHVFVASDALPKATVTSLRKAMLNLQDKQILASIKNSVTGMALVKDQDFDNLRQILSEEDRHDDRE